MNGSKTFCMQPFLQRPCLSLYDVEPYMPNIPKDPCVSNICDMCGAIYGIDRFGSPDQVRINRHLGGTVPSIRSMAFILLHSCTILDCIKSHRALGRRTNTSTMVVSYNEWKNYRYEITRSTGNQPRSVKVIEHCLKGSSVRQKISHNHPN